MKKDRLAFLLLLPPLVACPGRPVTVVGDDVPLPAGLVRAERGVTSEGLLRDTSALSDDALEGRAPGTAGDRAARAYVARRLGEMGYEPAGPGGAWEQSIPLVRIAAERPAAWSFVAGTARAELRWGTEFIAAAGRPEGVVRFDDAEVVFAGYGIQAPEEGWDDFKGVDLHGKVLLLLNNDPDWDPKLFGGKKRLYYGRWTYKYESAARQGAVAALLIHTDASAAYGWNVVRSSWAGPQFELPAGDEPRLLAKAWITEAAARRLAALSGKDLDVLVESARSRDFRPVPLGIKTSLTLRSEIATAQTANVLGMLRGSDPGASPEVVVYSAHHDHLGVGEPDASGDAVYNGALDNASGVAQLLSIAGAFSALPERPRRCILVMAVAAEEAGLLGSAFYAAHPTVPAGRIVADINIDGGNVFGRTRDVAVIGRGKSTLEDVLATAARRQGRVVVDEPDPDKGYYYRSDQLSFARIGVPSLNFRSGYDYVGRSLAWGRERNEDYRLRRYHQPNDEVDASWDLAGMVEDARLAFEVGLRVASAGPRPEWYPGDEFERVRKASLSGSP